MLVLPACRPFLKLDSRGLSGNSVALGNRERRAGMAVVNELDAFDAIVMAEARFHGEGYQEGYVEGTHAGAIEGRQYGIQQGAKIALEIGSYLGFSMTWLRLLHKHSDDKLSKKIKVLESLIEMIQKFPHQDPTYNKLQEDLERIRGRFKQNLTFLQMNEPMFDHLKDSIRSREEATGLTPLEIRFHFLNHKHMKTDYT